MASNSPPLEPEVYRILKFIDVEGARKRYWLAVDSISSFYDPAEMTLDETTLRARLHQLRIISWFFFNFTEVRASVAWLKEHNFTVPEAGLSSPRNYKQRRLWRKCFRNLT